MNNVFLHGSAFNIPQFEELATSAGFNREQSLRTVPSLKFEQWRNDFALMAIFWVPSAQHDPFMDVFAKASEFISLLLKEDEMKGRFIDGYIILALPETPKGALCDSIRLVESNTAVCRKHVIWPDSNNSWDPTLYAITALGLPFSAATSILIKEPHLPKVAQVALQQRARGDSLDEVATIIQELSDTDLENSCNAN